MTFKPSEPFEVIGKIIPRYENENWTFTELLYEAPYLKSYQDEEDEEDEEADCLEYIDNTDKIIYLYYQDDKCVGKVKLRKNWNRYAYIEDIAVCKDFRGQGISSSSWRQAAQCSMCSLTIAEVSVSVNSSR